MVCNHDQVAEDYLRAPQLHLPPTLGIWLPTETSRVPLAAMFVGSVVGDPQDCCVPGPGHLLQQPAVRQPDSTLLQLISERTQRLGVILHMKYNAVGCFTKWTSSRK